MVQARDGGDSAASVQDSSTTVPDVDGPTDNGGPPTQPDLPEVKEADDGGFVDAPSDLEVADTVVDVDALPDAVPAGSDADAGVCGVVVETFIRPLSSPLDRDYDDSIGLPCWIV